VLREALQVAKRTGAVLIIAKLDRLARNVLFVAQLMESKVRFQCADMPQATELTLHIMAAMGQHERQMISERTKAALQAAKARGVTLGNPRLHLVNSRQVEEARQFADHIQLTLAGYRAQGLNKGQTVEALNAAQVPTPRGGAWSYALLRSVERRLQP
jgi:DNA invertase Pin-like site-specific DNA recombinase